MIKILLAAILGAATLAAQVVVTGKTVSATQGGVSVSLDGSVQPVLKVTVQNNGTSANLMLWPRNSTATQTGSFGDGFSLVSYTLLPGYLQLGRPPQLYVWTYITVAGMQILTGFSGEVDL